MSGLPTLKQVIRIITGEEPGVPKRQRRPSDHPADGDRGMTVPLTSKPYARSSYFCCFRLRQPLPAEIGIGIIGGIGNPASPAGSGDAADASCTGVCEVATSFTTAGGAVRFPMGTPAPKAAVGA